MTPSDRLSREEIRRHLADCPTKSRDIVLRLREIILDTAPEVCEAIKFNALCYFKPTSPYGAIGGNVCMIESSKGSIVLSFIHGAFLPDPECLLRGSGKAKRRISIRSLADADCPSIRALLLASVAYDPPTQGQEA